ncbi:glycosyltransferase family 2 protein [Gorillibacterium sp. sgz5001074]|uniref:glycosyltransferase family 2 protein n=1 Tax=Gorillibacterium sp. sgz5001074 TaxID=3446695 RepID=UPI003F67E144
MSDGRQPLVGVILLNYNGYKDTVECLKSLKHLKYSNTMIYVVDNCSPDGSGDQLSVFLESFESDLKIKFMALKKNIGFSGGNNVAIKDAISEGAEYVWLLNNDTIVEEDTLNFLVEAARRDDRIGIVGSKIYYYGGSLIWFAGGKVNKLGMISHVGSYRDDTSRELYSHPEETGYVTGCSLLARVKMIQEIGLLDEDFFLYYEDTEWNMRARKRGWKIQYEPRSVLWHKVSASTGSKFRDHAPIIDYYNFRNAILFVRKSYSSAYRLLPFVGVMIMLAKRHIRLMTNSETRKGKKISMIYKALIDGVNGRTGTI